jgi:hypothetical protein
MSKLIFLLSLLAALPGLAGCVTGAAMTCTQMPDGHYRCSADADWNTVGM